MGPGPPGLYLILSLLVIVLFCIVQCIQLYKRKSGWQKRKERAVREENRDPTKRQKTLKCLGKFLPHEQQQMNSSTQCTKAIYLSPCMVFYTTAHIPLGDINGARKVSIVGGGFGLQNNSVILGMLVTSFRCLSSSFAFFFHFSWTRTISAWKP